MAISNPNPLNFIINEKLGSGSNATVFKASLKTGVNKAVAIKCISKKQLNKSAIDNLLSEISILKGVKHDHIVEMYDFIWDENYIYLIMELCCGGDLSGYIKKYKFLPEQVVQKFLQQLATAFQCLHQLNILHMDLKPQNILITSHQNPKLKIADFGFAQKLNTDTKMNHLRGSLLYMAPEVYLEGFYSDKCDLWSIGVIIYECIFGRAPFHSATLDELKNKLKDSSSVIEIGSYSPDNNELSSNLKELLRGLLQRNRDERISYSDFLNHSFIDLEHAPTKNSLSKSEVAFKEAVEMEKKLSEHNFSRINERILLSSIIDKYLDGLSHLIGAIRYDENSSRNTEMRMLFTENVGHVQQLKSQLNDLDSLANQSIVSVVTDTHDAVSAELTSISEVDYYQELSRLKDVCGDNAQLMKSIDCLHQFYRLVESNKFKEALELFKSCFQELYDAAKIDTNKSRKQLLYKQMDYAMNIAEQISNIITNQSKYSNNLVDSHKKRSKSSNINDICSIS